MNAYEIYRASLGKNGSKPALIAGLGASREAVSYEELAARVDRAATALRNRGLVPGDRVLLAVPVSIETYVVMLALLKSGMVTMFIDPAHGARQVASILRAWPPAAIVATRRIMALRWLVPELRRIPRRFTVGTPPSAGGLPTDCDAQARCPTVPRAPADSALLTFTSGSTGEPKPVIRSHGFLQRQLRALEPVAELDGEDVELVTMPMFVLFNLAGGIASVLPACDMKHPAQASPATLLRQLEEESVNRVVASPALLERLARFCLRRRLRLAGLRRVATGGGPVSPSLVRDLKRIAPAALIRMVYGSTEAEPIASLDHSEMSVSAAHRMRTGAGLLAGRPVAGCDVRIIDSQPGAAMGPLTAGQFDNASLPGGQVGEIVVAGPHVLSGYANAARNRLSKVEVGGRIWHRTGDAGYFDDDGRLWLCGRMAAAIRDSEGVVYPFQVEFALAGMPGIRRAALVGRDGKRVLVLETRGRKFSTDCATAAACIARHRIDSIVTVRKIPVDRRHGAKVDYRALSRLLEGRWGRARLAIVDRISQAFKLGRGGWRMLREFGRASVLAGVFSRR